MKIIWTMIKDFVIGIWVVVAIFATACLLTYNEYGVSQFGDYSLFVIDNKFLEPTLSKYDIIITEKDVENAYNVDDQVFFYYSNLETRSFVNLGTITAVTRIDRVEDNYFFNGTQVSYGNLIGKLNGAVVIKGWGLALSVLESRWGFMLLIIMPTIYAVVYEIYTISLEVKKEAKEEAKKEEQKKEE